MEAINNIFIKKGITIEYCEVIKDNPNYVACVNSEYIVRLSHPHCYYALDNNIKTMKYIRENTTIPIPEVVYYGRAKNKNAVLEYIVTRRVKGKSLDKIWTTCDRKAVCEQLSGYINQMRSLTSFSICNVSGCPLTHPLLGYERWCERMNNMGPFQTTSELLCSKIIARAMVYSCDNIHCDKNVPLMLFEFVDKLRSIPDTHFDNKFVFCHNDLKPSNIIVHENNVTAIIDWEFAGFYPPSMEAYTLPMTIGKTMPFADEWRKMILSSLNLDELFLRIIRLTSSISHQTTADSLSDKLKDLIDYASSYR